MSEVAIQSRRTFGEILDKHIIEVIAGKDPDSGLRLLLWDGTKAGAAPIIQLAPGIGLGSRRHKLFPPVIDATFTKAMRLPSHVEDYSSSSKLFADVHDLIRKFVDVPENLVSLIAYSVFASWFVDCTPTPVCLSLISPQPEQGIRILRLMSCLYRRPLLLNQPSVAGICSLPLDMQPALLIDAGEGDAASLKLLRFLNAHDAYVPWKGQLLHISGAKVICTQKSLSEDRLGVGFTEIRIPPDRRSMPLLDQRTQLRIAEEFQPALLMYRLSNYRKVALSEFDLPILPSPVRELGRTLGASFPEEPKLQEEISILLQELADQIVVKSNTDLDSVIVEAVLALCHEKDRQSFHVADVAQETNRILEDRGETLQMSPWAVGRKLAKLDITTQRLDSAGRGVLLLNATREHVHQLASKKNMSVIDEHADDCSQCMSLLNRERDETRTEELATESRN